MTTLCAIAGSPDLYGLGIRLSFYLLWFSVLIGERCHERHAQVPRAVELVLAYAVFLGLAMAASAGALFASEVYVALLLISTTVYLLVPRHTTDLVAWVRPDFGLGTQRGRFGFGAFTRSLFVLIVISLHFWFWGTGVNSVHVDRALREQGCRPPPQVGFAFGPVDMHSGGFRAMNVLLMLALLTGGVIIGAMKAGVIRRRQSRRRRRANRARIRVLKQIETFAGLTVACILVAAIELTIQWNGISPGVNDVTTAAQLIPLGLVIALILVFLYDLRNGARRRASSSSSGGGGSTPDPSSSSSGWIGYARYSR
ncbi:hypothetical protein N658DRAFT_419349 [Parathielavia hyrcaniae]|uniref:Uncharacterized protein n=1 Tax=Parathielavia hyrcaniae TaxID=113614 RepID=A0AAN6T548_9PEZI|nr:hypothetical protein N658DRAFT_419349 [Parathielavia hyrcaniae]